jgi:uncharacterized Zn finger protein
MPENAQAKARRLCAEGRVTVRTVTDLAIVAKVRGDSAAVYHVTWSPGGWSCSCPSLRRCSHIGAVQLCTLAPLPLEGPGP